MSDYHPPIYSRLVSERLKLLIDTGSNTVVHAVVSKRFVDCLILMLNLPMTLGTFAGLTVTGQVVNGSVGNLLTSIQNLIDSHHILTNGTSFFEPLRPPRLKRVNTGTHGHNVEAAGPFCPDCRNDVSVRMHYMSAPMVKEGFYMVTDDLVVKPMPALPKRGGLSTTEERVMNVVIGKVEAVKLVHAFMISKNVFTDVFILKLWPVISRFKFLPAWI